MVTYGRSFHEMSISMLEMLNDSNQSRTKFNNLATELRGRITSIENSTAIVDTFFKNLINYKSTRFSFIFIFVTIIISIAGVILLYWLFMIFTMKLKKCMFLNKICQVIMMTKVCLGIFTSAAAIACILITTVMINMCSIYDRSFTDKSLSDVILEQAKSNNFQFVEYARKCAYAQTGSMKDFVNSTMLADYEEILKKFDSLQFLGAENLTIYRTSTSNTPPVYTNFSGTLSAYETFSLQAGSQESRAEQIDLLDNHSVNGFSENLQKMRVAVQSVDEFKPFDVFEITEMMCSTARYQSLMRAQDYMAEPKKKPDSPSTKFCFAFLNNMINFKIDQRYGDTTQAAKNAANSFKTLA